MKGSPFRITGAFFLGFLAGVSFVSAVFPFAMSAAVGVSSVEVLFLTDRFTVHAGALWGVCAGVLGRFGGVRLGVALLGVCGLVTGLFLAAAALGQGTAGIAAGALTGVCYGGVGGLLLGSVFRKPGGRE